MSTAAGRVEGLARATHLAPTLAVTAVITGVGWAVGWRGGQLALLLLAVLVGQLSVGWCNDAFDARLDAVAERTDKPTVAGLVSVGLLWRAAIAAVVTACLLSWAAAGWIGGSWHVLSLAMAWLYNTVLSRTAWSWLPYAVAFGAVPAFLTLGIDAGAPPAWLVIVFAVVGVSAHLANALPDLERDAAAGLGGLAVHLGHRWSVAACWLLLGLGSAVLVVVLLPVRPWLAVLVAVAYVGALVAGSVVRRPRAMFAAIVAAVLVDVAAMIAGAAALV